MVICSTFWSNVKEIREPGLQHVSAAWDVFSKARIEDLIQPDLPRASLISYLTALAIKSSKRREGYDSSRGITRGLHSLCGNLLVAFQ